MPINNIIDVQITRQLAGLTRVGFGTMLFVYEVEEALGNRVAAFGSIDDVVDEFGSESVPAQAAAAFFASSPRPPLLKIAYKLDTETWVEALDEVRAIDINWYALTIDSAVTADLLAVSAWALPRDIIYIAKSADEDILDGNADADAASQLLAAGYERTGLVYHSLAASAYPDLAWAGGNLTRDPGTYSWHAKQAPGIPGETFSFTQVQALDAKRCSRVETIAGATRVFGGYVSAPGSFLDDIQAADWLTQRVRESVFDLLLRVPKISRTNRGISQVESAIWAPLRVAVNSDVVADNDQLTVSVPDISDVDPIDRENRILPDVNFSAQLTGAFHSIIVRGTLTV